MDTELLKTFMEVYKAGRFSRAAENLYLTQSAVSFRIRQLEQNLGVALFARQRSQLTLTAAGERLLPHAEAILSNLERARLEVALGEDQHNQLAIGGTPNIWDGVLSEALPRIHQALPALAMRAESLPSAQLTRQLLERTLDMAVMFDPPKAEGLQIEELPCVRLLPVTTFDDGSMSDYVHVDWGTAFDIRLARQNGPTPRPVLRVSTSHIALRFLLSCGGSAYLPEDRVADLISEGRLRLVENEPTVERQVFCAWNEHSENRELLNEIRDLLKQGRELDLN
ncbi:LysR family transcriptional regulator [Ferrimonas balearica]|uniref:LysR substrate-binding domain-containing protein n=1 Tax=Ferrimonas balearica TaxID=44012 RepID=UPI001C55FDB8|nr:LysR substrate-binding domain-containing protein [Ferrimonas balearica]MBW3141118.1 LysR family transcriptional regulator [Ferrimonas balearica]